MPNRLSQPQKMCVSKTKSGTQLKRLFLLWIGSGLFLAITANSTFSLVLWWIGLVLHMTMLQNFGRNNMSDWGTLDTTNNDILVSKQYLSTILACFERTILITSS